MVFIGKDISWQLTNTLCTCTFEIHKKIVVYTEHPEALPAKGAYVNIYAELMSFFSRNLWRKIWEAITPAVIAEEQGTNIEDLDLDLTSLDELCTEDSNCLPERRLAILDNDGSGEVTVEDIHHALSDILQLSVDTTGTETSLAEFVHSFADIDSDGVVTLDDLENFCDEIPKIYESQKWRLAFPRPEKIVEEIIEEEQEDVTMA